MAGEVKLEVLLHSMSPELIDGEFVFCTIANSSYGDYKDSHPIASFSEPEGLSLVMSRDAADKAGLVYAGIFRCISLRVHSSLQAVGLTAAVSTLLAESDIAANMIAAHFHDHVFVRTEHAARAIDILSAVNN